MSNVLSPTLMKCKAFFVLSSLFRHVSPSIWTIVVCKEFFARWIRRKAVSIWSK